MTVSVVIAAGVDAVAVSTFNSTTEAITTTTTTTTATTTPSTASSTAPGSSSTTSLTTAHPRNGTRKKRVTGLLVPWNALSDNSLYALTGHYLCLIAHESAILQIVVVRERETSVDCSHGRSLFLITPRESPEHRDFNKSVCPLFLLANALRQVPFGSELPACTRGLQSENTR